jgi:hypothetical protein
MRRGDALGMPAEAAKPPAVMENRGDNLPFAERGEFPWVTAMFMRVCSRTEWTFIRFMREKEEPAINKFIAALFEDKLPGHNLVNE